MQAVFSKEPPLYSKPPPPSKHVSDATPPTPTPLVAAHGTSEAGHVRDIQQSPPRPPPKPPGVLTAPGTATVSPPNVSSPPLPYGLPPQEPQAPPSRPQAQSPVVSSSGVGSVDPRARVSQRFLQFNSCYGFLLDFRMDLLHARVRRSIGIFFVCHLAFSYMPKTPACDTATIYV